MSTTQRSFSEVFKKNLRRVLNYWTQISVILGLSATALGFLVLYSYTQAINRLDLFMTSIDVKTSLSIWILLVLGSIIAYLFVLTVTTWMFGMSVSLFTQIPDKQKYVATWLLPPVLLGFFAFVGLNFFAVGKIPPLCSVLIVALTVIVICFVLAEFPKFRQLVRENLSSQGNAPGIWDEALFISLLAILVFVCVTTGVFPALLTLHAYNGEDTEAAVFYIAILTTINMLLTICPVIIFYWANGDIYKRVFYAVLASAFILILSLIMSPGALVNMTYTVSGNLDVRRQDPERFMLLDDLSLKDFDATIWKTRLTEKNRLEITGFQLYSFGEVLLICPTDLIVLKRKDLIKYTQFCLSTSNSKVVRKPLKPVTINRNPDCDLPKTWKNKVTDLPTWAIASNTSCLNRYLHYASWRPLPDGK